jgi:hypothetical protein
MRKKIEKLKRVKEVQGITEEERELANTLIEKFSKKIKNNIEKEKRTFNTHHIVARSRGGSNSKINTRKLNERFHSNWHRVFNNLTPTEQLLLVATENQQVFTKEFKTAIVRLIEDFGAEAYKDKVFL